MAGIWFLSSRSTLPSPVSFPFQDKVIHAVVFGGLCAAWLWALMPRRHASLIAILITVIYGAIDEWHQSYVPGRSSEFADFFADGFGAMVSCLLFFRIYKNKNC